MTFHLVLSVTCKRAIVALEFLDVQVLLPDMHRQGIVSANAFTAVGTNSHFCFSRNIAIRIVDIFLVQNNLEIGVR